jgi:hypothetical protein
VKNRPCWESTTPAIVVCKRSWRQFFGPCQQNLKNAYPEYRGLWKVPQPWKSHSVAFGNFYLPIPTAAWKAQNAFHTFHKARRLDTNWKPEDQNILAGTDSEGVETLVPNTCTMAGFELITVGRFWGDN